MTDPTPLDLAHAAMTDAPDDDTARLGFYERLADGELFLLLDAEPEGDAISPRPFATEDGTFVLVFDREERLAAFAETTAPYAALSGRLVASMLAGQGFGLAVNPGVAPSSILIPAPAVDWLAQTLAHAPEATEARAQEFTSPGGLPERLITALDTKLAAAAGLARMAYLVGVSYDGGGRSHLLAVVNPAPGAEAALARAVAEALTFSGIEAGALDVGFFKASDPVTAKLARVGLRFDLPEPPTAAEPQTPGSDPARPPILR
ncbi:SseB family protein [Pseudoruegeria sp. SK021]|uniref:SseB family protein n=1 Tax=Pseudoruegeria sp. SK021 TaxID=1933035 RepID=UPI000A216114|nr:SseB family protein [Pseudoruegeria sp. SK021]OSP53892.1 hypothetical protein BV911_15535 [Pseudoruegeria sp. SK021]